MLLFFSDGAANIFVTDLSRMAPPGVQTTGSNLRDPLVEQGCFVFVAHIQPLWLSWLRKIQIRRWHRFLRAFSQSRHGVPKDGQGVRDMHQRGV